MSNVVIIWGIYVLYIEPKTYHRNDKLLRIQTSLSNSPSLSPQPSLASKNNDEIIINSDNPSLVSAMSASPPTANEINIEWKIAQQEIHNRKNVKYELDNQTIICHVNNSEHIILHISIVYEHSNNVLWYID